MPLTILKLMDISKFGKGAIPIPLAIKDYRLELATAALPAVLPLEFSLEEHIGKVKNQGSSGSCVAQAFSSYAEVLSKLETGKYVGLSARDIYSLIFIEPEGAWLKDGAAKICKSGVVLEQDAPSYDNGNPPSEQFMRLRDDITQAEIYKGYDFLAKSYFTWNTKNIQKWKEAIIAGNGVVSSFPGANVAWADTNILPILLPQAEWWHAVYICGYSESRKAFRFVNSWSEEWGGNGFGWLPYEYLYRGHASNPLTLLDVPNDTYIKLLSQIMNLYQKIISFIKK